MRKQYHILNGDALNQQFPKNIQGEIIVTRECFVEGNVEGKNLEQLFTNRIEFLHEFYGVNKQDYYENAVSGFLKILNIEDADIHLWFEDDLFCQVNFWFVSNLLDKNNESNQVYLIRPPLHSQYSFANLDKSELISIHENKIALTELDEISKLWKAYQANDNKKMNDIAIRLEHKYPFIISAVKAHIQRIPSEGKLGRPTDSLISIINELETEEFEKIFRAFSKKESIYGFGDLQVKRLYDQIKKDMLS